MKKAGALLLFILSVSAIQAQDRQFVRTYQSTNLAKGVRDLEVWSTLRMGKESYFRRLDERLEFEIGLTDRLQTAFYLNMSHMTFAIKGDSTGTLYSASQFSVSSEWKLKLSDASTSFIGSGIYGEVLFSGDEIELEAKLILDKKFGNHLIAFNAVGEFEWESEVEIEGKNANGEVKQEIEYELEATPVEFDMAYMYNFNPSWGLGLEARNHYEITPKGGLEHSALLLGPTLYWSAKDSRHSIIFNFLPQIANMNKSAAQPDALDLDEYEKYDFRLLIDFTF
jgi:hypothetical protein